MTPASTPSVASDYETFLRRKAEAEEMAEIAAIISDSLFDEKEDTFQHGNGVADTTSVTIEEEWVREFMSTFDKVNISYENLLENNLTITML